MAKLAMIILVLLAGLYLVADHYYYHGVVQDVDRITRHYRRGEFQRVEALQRSFRQRHKLNALSNLIRLVRDESKPALDRLLAQKVLASLKDQLTDRDTNQTRDVLSATELDLGLDAEAMDVMSLLRVLRGKDEVKMVDAVKALAKKKDKDALGPLIKLLTHKYWRLRLEAARAIGGYGDKAKEGVDPLLALMEDPVDEVACAAAEALGRIGDRKVYERLVNFLDERFVPAARALGELGDRRAVAKLSHSLDRANLEQVLEAAKALERLGDSRGFARLKELLQSGSKFQRAGAARAIGRLGKANSVDLLSPALQDSSWEVRAAAAEALGGVPGPKALADIKAVLTSDKKGEVLVAAARALKSFKSLQAYEVVERCLRCPNQGVVLAAIDAVVANREKRAVPYLEELLKSDLRLVRMRAWEALHRLTGSEYDLRR